MIITVLVTGGSGMVGMNLREHIFSSKKTKNENVKWIFISSKDCDLTKTIEVDSLFKNLKPTHIVHLAANVGGLFKNLREGVNMFKDNVRINENVMEACHKYDVQQGIFCLSSCVFPFNPSKYPMTESMLHESIPHPSNIGYGYAKRAMEIQCQNYNKQYGRKYICLIPVNLYGKHDNFNLEDSHVIAGMIHRLYVAKMNNTSFEMYGTGKPLRQFIYVCDFVKIISDVLFCDAEIGTFPINCCNDEISMKKLAHIISRFIGYDKKILNNTSKSDGCLRKTIDGSRFKKLFPDFEYSSLEFGIKQTIAWFIENYNMCRK